jgi:hypothetical protein
MRRFLLALAVVVGLTHVLYAASLSDSFDRADNDSLGANWTEAVGDADIASNTYRLSTGSFGKILSVYTGTELGSVDQWAAITLGATECQYPALQFRSDDSSSAHYALELSCNNAEVKWYSYSSWAETSPEEVEAQDLGTDLLSDRVGATVCGTGASTVVRVWVNPTNTPSSCTDWDGDTSPTATYATDPASPVNAGNFIGLGGGQGTPDAVTLNDFAGGDFGGGAPATTECRNMLLLGVGGPCSE